MLMPAKSVFLSWLGPVLDFLRAGEIEWLNRSLGMVASAQYVIAPFFQNKKCEGFWA
jgi:hypothetical protein